MKIPVSILSLLLLSFVGTAQDKYFTKTGKIQFFSKTPAEDIDATNRSAAVTLDRTSGDLQFAVLMKGFEFKKALMQEHFNKDFVESSKFPKAEFKGQISNNSEVKYQIDGAYPVKVKGKLTIHGVTNDVETTGTITVKAGKLTAVSTFNIQLPDYNIKVPAVNRSQISDKIQITVNCALNLLKS